MKLELVFMNFEKSRKKSCFIKKFIKYISLKACGIRLIKNLKMTAHFGIFTATKNVNERSEKEEQLSGFSVPQLSIICEHLTILPLWKSYLLFKHAITLHRLVSNEIPTFEWLALHFNIILTSRMVNFKVIPEFNYKIGQSILTNRFQILNGLIPLDWLNKS